MPRKNRTRKKRGGGGVEWEIGPGPYTKCWKKIGRKNFVTNTDKEMGGWKVNRPRRIGERQTTSQPTLITQMLQQAFEKCTKCQLPQTTRVRALDIGSGSGVVTALLACLIGKGKGNEVIGIDKFESLVEQSKKNITTFPTEGFAKMTLETQDIYELFKNPLSRGKFDIIYVGAEPKTTTDIKTFTRIIPKLLKKDGVAIAPIDGALQIYSDGGWKRTAIGTRFVPLER